MATTNIAYARINGVPIKEDQIKLGLIVDYQSGMGGTIKCECVEISEQGAKFLPVNKAFPKWAGFEAKFNEPDLSAEEFESLERAMMGFNAFGELPTQEQRLLVGRAHSLGYVNQVSYTQASWTEAGIQRWSDANKAKASETN
ncbi:hypothetical protein HUO09_17645 [Vibrio sp. Y2-5]|uniref:hypothetical protein n=1 Tax=Vibrio sp. Y2-5 TaxID=2743977 RepID=UPI00166023B3|nr:hypothetical protein [Vibrio sp. Y2-5]MBD0788182.1 hypothetical protein [Vibrio sp. Y2-5]